MGQVAYQWAFLRNLVEGLLSSQEANLMVRDCWVNNAWDLSIISVTLPKDIVQEILATPIQWYGADADTWAWYSNAGVFSHKSAYSLIDCHTSTPPFESQIGLGLGRLKLIRLSFSLFTILLFKTEFPPNFFLLNF